MANSSLDLSDRAVLGSLARLLSSVRRAADDTPILLDRLYDEESEGLASFAFDFEETGAWLLGKDAREVLAHGFDQQTSLDTVDAILRPEIDPDGALRLVAQMPPGDRERQVSLLTAFHAGLLQRPIPRRPDSE